MHPYSWNIQIILFLSCLCGFFDVFSHFVSAVCSRGLFFLVCFSLSTCNTTNVFVWHVAEFKLRSPQGTKTKFYKRAKLEKFAPYVNQDGLVCRLSIYDDNQRQSTYSSLVLLYLLSLLLLLLLLLVFIFYFLNARVNAGEKKFKKK